MSGDRDRFDERFATAEADGRTLVVSRESRVWFHEPFVLASTCDSKLVEGGLRHITAFALAVAGIVTILILVRAAPAPLAIFALVWIAGAVFARRWARKRRRELGRTLLDFEFEKATFAPLEGSTTELPLEGACAVKEASNDDEAPIWLVLRLADGTRIRLCRGEDRDVDRVLVVLRRFHVRVGADS